METLSSIVLDEPDIIKEGSMESEIKGQCDKGGRDWNDEAVRQGQMTAYSNQKRQGTYPPLEPPRGTSLADTLIVDA